MPQHFDALVVGGGPGGATAALALAGAGWSVALVECRAFPRRKVCGEYLSLTNWPLFERLGLADAFSRLAGPEISQVALMSGATTLVSELPRAGANGAAWGRALSRERLDTLLVDAARRAGVDVRQPARVVAWERTRGGHACQVLADEQGDVRELHATIVVAAHGSWETGPLATQPTRMPPRDADLLGFKAHFHHSRLAEGLMPLLSFADGYGGMVHCEGGRVSFSCCLRRDRLESLRRQPGESAGDAVFEYVLSACPAVREVVDASRRDGPWLAAGPIRPGIRRRYHDGVFVVGNAAGEAHPVVAEGISMAMQSAWLLGRRLAADGRVRSRRSRDEAMVDSAGRDYAALWRHTFAGRIRAAAAVAHWAMRPAAVRAVLPIIRRCPALLTWGARLSGKSRLLVDS
ncbi:MAG TPA: FAD-dependent monooxygenase [Pirellulales bacterium]|nr:FAD-dependent monooxygenase [Pirellulales bacterium]